jgi:hypothetical protein
MRPAGDDPGEMPTISQHAPSPRAPPARDAAAAAPASCCHGDQRAAPLDAPRDHAVSHPHRAPWPWGEAAANTLFCLLGCSLGDVAVVIASRLWWTSAGMASVMASATIAGLASSLALETIWLAARGQRVARALRMAVGMSLLSMLAMETAMNLVDVVLTGGNRMHLPWLSYAGVLAVGEVAGFLLPWPFNAWRLARGQACH